MRMFSAKIFGAMMILTFFLSLFGHTPSSPIRYSFESITYSNDPHLFRSAISPSASYEYGSIDDRWVLKKITVKITTLSEWNGKKIIKCRSVQTPDRVDVNFIGSDQFFKKGSSNTVYDYVISKASAQVSMDKTEISPDQSAVVTILVNSQIPPGACSVMLSWSQYWECEYSDGSKAYHSASTTIRDDFSDKSPYYHGNIGHCISGYVSGEMCSGNSVGRYYADESGRVTFKVTEECSEGQVCTGGKCVWQEGWTGEKRCKDEKTVEGEWINADGSKQWKVVESCEDGKVCRDGSCVLESGWVGDEYCRDENTVVRDYRDESGNVSPKVVEVCENGEKCINGTCVAPPTGEGEGEVLKPSPAPYVPPSPSPGISGSAGQAPEEEVPPAEAPEVQKPSFLPYIVLIVGIVAGTALGVVIFK